VAFHFTPYLLFYSSVRPFFLLLTEAEQGRVVLAPIPATGVVGEGELRAVHPSGGSCAPARWLGLAMVAHDGLTTGVGGTMVAATPTAALQRPWDQEKGDVEVW